MGRTGWWGGGVRVRSYGEVMEVRLFGELEAVAAGVPVPVRGAKQRVLLALLALQRGQPVSAAGWFCRERQTCT